MSSRSGYSKTNARKTPVKTSMRAFAIDRSAHTPTNTATTRSKARMGTTNSIGRRPSPEPLS